jgi:hypothetical protein
MWNWLVLVVSCIACAQLSYEMTRCRGVARICEVRVVKREK